MKKGKSLNYYSGWHKDDWPVTQETKEEKQKRLSDINKKKIKNYFFLCALQSFDFPLAKLLHFLPAFVLPAHLSAFFFAII